MYEAWYEKNKIQAQTQHFIDFVFSRVSQNCEKRIHWTSNFKKMFVSVMNMLLIYLYASMKLEKGHKNYLALVLKLCHHYDILRNVLEYYRQRWIK